jgi:hypothetical protein
MPGLVANIIKNTGDILLRMKMALTGLPKEASYPNLKKRYTALDALYSKLHPFITETNEDNLDLDTICDIIVKMQQLDKIIAPLYQQYKASVSEENNQLAPEESSRRLTQYIISQAKIAVQKRREKPKDAPYQNLKKLYNKQDKLYDNLHSLVQKNQKGKVDINSIKNHISQIEQLDKTIIPRYIKHEASVTKENNRLASDESLRHQTQAAVAKIKVAVAKWQKDHPAPNKVSHDKTHPALSKRSTTKHHDTQHSAKKFN